MQWKTKKAAISMMSFSKMIFNPVLTGEFERTKVRCNLAGTVDDCFGVRQADYTKIRV
jgi:hypothetical protein